MFTRAIFFEGSFLQGSTYLALQSPLVIECVHQSDKNSVAVFFFRGFKWELCTTVARGNFMHDMSVKYLQVDTKIPSPNLYVAYCYPSINYTMIQWRYFIHSLLSQSKRDDDSSRLCCSLSIRSQFSFTNRQLLLGLLPALISHPHSGWQRPRPHRPLRPAAQSHTETLYRPFIYASSIADNSRLARPLDSDCSLSQNSCKKLVCRW